MEDSETDTFALSNNGINVSDKLESATKSVTVKIIQANAS
jgi:hypothetical protein